MINDNIKTNAIDLDQDNKQDVLNNLVRCKCPYFNDFAGCNALSRVYNNHRCVQLHNKVLVCHYLQTLLDDSGMLDDLIKIKSADDTKIYKKICANCQIAFSTDKRNKRYCIRCAQLINKQNMRQICKKHYLKTRDNKNKITVNMGV